MENSTDFINFISDKLSKTKFDKLPELFMSSKKMVTMRLKHPERLTASQVSILIELTGLTINDFKPYIN
jgi:hypothetical protein